MSRIGDASIIIPSGVSIEIDGSQISVSGPKGGLSMNFVSKVQIEKQENRLFVKRKGQDKVTKALHGLTRSLINNMVVGVTEGFSKNLEMVGIGYRAAGGGDTLSLAVGFSHPVTIKAPEGISFVVAENTKITVSGIDKSLVGQVAANIRAVKPPEVYKGKGIRYSGEYVRRKIGKAGKAVGGVK